jgi:hypothetical protein
VVQPGPLRTLIRFAAAESRITAQRLHEIPSQWRELTGPVRRGSAAAKILALLPGAPILSTDDAIALIDAPRSSVFDAIGRLCDVGVLRALTDRRRNQIWGAGLVLDELEGLGVRQRGYSTSRCRTTTKAPIYRTGLSLHMHSCRTVRNIKAK